MSFCEKDDMTDAEIKKYITRALDLLTEYFVDGYWIANQTNIDILSRFIVDCSYRYPDKKAGELFATTNCPEATPRNVWTQAARELHSVSDRIQGRKAPGNNDTFVCHEARSALRILNSYVPDFWHGSIEGIDDKVINICDNFASYHRKEKW